MRRLPPDFIERVRLANDIVDIIGEDTFLKPSGERYMGLCPFPSHKEKTPSFSVSQDKQLYHCFGCGESGNIFTYLQVRRGMSFMEALKSLAQRAGVAFPTSVEIVKKSPVPFFRQRENLIEMNAFACDFYTQNLSNLPSDHEVKKYLKKRGLSEETIKKFRLGYVDAKWDGLVSHLKKHNKNLKSALHLGLVKQKGDRTYDLFRNRLIFPVLAQNGRDVLGFGARALEEGQPKYINSQDSDIFHKGQTFYGWWCSVEEIRSGGSALLVEGYMDFLALYQQGIRSVVAGLGTALTENHARWLARHTERVILCFDGDPAGQKAMERSLSTFLSFGLAPKILKLNKGEDPDSFIREKGEKAFRKKMENVNDLFLYLFSEELKNYPSEADRFALIKKIANILVYAKEGAVKRYYTDRFLDSFGFEGEIARQALKTALIKKQREKSSFDKSRWVEGSKRETKKIVQKLSIVSDKSEKHTKDEESEVVAEKISLRSAPNSELFLLILALESPKYYQEIKDSGVIEKFNHLGVIEMFKVIEKYSQQELEYFSALPQILSISLKDPREIQKERHPAVAHLSAEKVKEFMEDCVQKVEEETARLRLKNITTNIRMDQKNTKKYLAEMSKEINLRRNKDTNRTTTENR